MKERNADIGRKERAGHSLRARILRCSPFEFGTLKEMPGMTWAFPFFLLFFGMLWHISDQYFDNTTLLRKLSPHSADDVVEFVRNERSRAPKKSQILISGDSRLGLGVSSKVVENRTKLATTKVSMSVATMSDTYLMLKKYEHESKHVRLVINSIDPASIRRNTKPNYIQTQKGRFLFFRDWNDAFIPANNEFLSVKETLLPVRISVKDYFKYRFEPTTTYESRWDDDHSIRLRKKTLAKYKEKEKNARNGNRDIQPLKRSRSFFYDEAVKATFEYVKYCEDKGIHVVFVRIPAWYGHESVFAFSPSVRAEYEKFIDQLKSLPNCSVIEANNFEEIDPTCVYEDYYRDSIHMTRKGATIYTNWLLDRMEKDEKIVTALETPRQAEEFFVKKQAGIAYRAVVGLFKPAKSLQSAPAPATVASPARENPIR